MLALTTRSQWMIGSLLLLFLIVTRGHHFASLTHLPDASWSVFFLAGVYLRSRRVLPLLIILAGALDYMAISYGGVSDFCVSSAYILLLPAYTCLWLAGYWYAKRYKPEWHTLVILTATILASASLCEVISSGGFYFFSGSFEATSLAEFGVRLVKYFPFNLQSMAFYVGMAVIVHLVFTLVSDSVKQHRRIME